MEKNQNSIIAFVIWLTEKYIELEKRTLPYPCKLTGTLFTPTEKLVQIQFSGQSHEIKINIESIIEKNLFEYFSPQDKKLLFAIAHNKERLILSDRFSCPDSNTELVTLTDIATGNKKTMTAYLACIDNNIICQMNAKDAKNLGFLAGIEQGKKIINSR